MVRSGHIIALVAFAAVLGSCSAGALVSRRAIDGILDCGSQSTIVDTRFTDCTGVPCETVIGRQYRVEVEFRPNFSHSKLRLSIVLVQAPEHHEVVDAEVADSAVEAGVSYTFGYTVSITGAFQNDALMAFNLVGDGPAGREIICLGITLRVLG